MYRVCWKIGKVTGRGEPLPYDVVKAWVDWMKKEYGRGTHWVEPV